MSVSVIVVKPDGAVAVASGAVESADAVEIVAPTEVAVVNPMLDGKSLISSGCASRLCRRKLCRNILPGFMATGWTMRGGG